MIQSWYDSGARLAQATSVLPGPISRTGGPTTIDDLIGQGPETGLKPFDPLNLGGQWGTSDEFDKLAWFRHAEIKHGRVAMAAFVGYLVTVSGTFLPGDLTLDGTKATCELASPQPMRPFDACHPLRSSLILALTHSMCGQV